MLAKSLKLLFNQDMEKKQSKKAKQDMLLTTKAMEEVARRLRAISDPIRLRILYTLRDAEHSVGSLAEELELPQPTISRHLGQLYQNKILARQQVGNQVYYAVADESIFGICQSMCQRIKDEFEEERDAF